MFAATYHGVMSTGALLVMTVVLASCLASSLIATTQTAVAAGATLVNTISTSQWTPPSPDPSGITYWPARGHLLVVDGEVEETPHWQGANVFRVTLQGSLQKTYSTTSFSQEPVGVDIDVAPNGHIFISDDNKKTIWEISLGGDGELGTSDDVRRSFLTSSFGNNDPEGLTVASIGGKLKLFMVDGTGAEVFISDPGANGQFDGGGDDVVTQFDVAGLGIADPEGIDYDPATGTLWTVDRKLDRLHEVTTSGQLRQTIDLRTFITGIRNPGDVTIAPSSKGLAAKTFYIVDRGVDNNTDPNENDGKIYEVALGTTPPPSGNLLANPSFEVDANGDTRPDGWSTHTKFTRSNAIPPVAGSYVGRFFATDNSGANTNQTVAASAGTTYAFACSANIPQQNDATSFSVKFQVRWLNSSNSTISTWTVTSLTAPTQGWVSVTGSKAAPSGTAKAQIRLAVTSLNGAIYVDQCSFGS